MKKTSYYLIFIVVIGITLVSFWTYQKYFKKEATGVLSFKVERGNIQDMVKVRGEVVPQKDFNLEFPFSGTVEKILVAEGQQVKPGDPLIKLETTDLNLEVKNLNAQLLQAKAIVKAQQAKLDELMRGTRFEEIQVQNVKIANAQMALADAKKYLFDKLHDAYTKADDAIRGKADQLFTNPQTQDPRLKFMNVTEQYTLASERFFLEYSVFPSWKISLNQLSITSDISSYITEAKNNLNEIKSFLDKLSLLINNPNTTYNGEIQPGWKTDIDTARSNINTAIGNITSAEEKIQTAESNLSLEKQQLALQEAGVASEQIRAQQAKVDEVTANVDSVQAQIESTQEKILKSTIYSPAVVKIKKIWLEKGELAKVGTTAISLETFGYKVQADISELEIVKIREVDGNEVQIKLDAFPGSEIKGKVISVDPEEIVKEGDKYYRTNIYMGPSDLKIRSGMSTDLVILASAKDDVLKIPELAVSLKDGRKLVNVLENGKQKEVEITTGISDGESIEVMSGLTEGQTIIVSAD